LRLAPAPTLSVTITTSSWPGSQSRSAAQNPAEPVPTTTVLALTTGTSRPSMVSGSAPGRSWAVVIEDLLCWLRGRHARSALQRTLGRTARDGVGSEPGDVHPAVDVDDLPGGVGHPAGGKLHDGAGHVSGGAPPWHRGQAAGELLVVLLLHRGGHVGGDHPGAHLVDEHPFRGQAGGPQLGGHP